MKKSELVERIDSLERIIDEAYLEIENLYEENRVLRNRVINIERLVAEKPVTYPVPQPWITPWTDKTTPYRSPNQIGPHTVD